MLTVRDKQMLVFREAAVVQYEARMLDYLRETYPRQHAALGEVAARNLVRHGIAFAKLQGMGSVGSVSVVIDLMARFGERFENSGAAEWVNQMFARRTLPAEVRIESIIKHLNAKTGGRTVVAAGADQSGH